MTGPTWFGLYGSKVDLADGTTVTADDAYLKESILNPNAKVVAGFNSGLMPAFALSDADIANLIAYFKTLK
jgi:mono/diheme cytochrome c family protein